MSDPQPDRLKKRPPRAEPLQPDRPGRGDSPDTVDGPLDPAKSSSTAVERKSAEKLKEQSDAARQNVSEGYD